MIHEIGKSIINEDYEKANAAIVLELESLYEQSKDIDDKLCILEFMYRLGLQPLEDY